MIKEWKGKKYNAVYDYGDHEVRLEVLNNGTMYAIPNVPSFCFDEFVLRAGDEDDAVKYLILVSKEASDEGHT